MNNGAQMLVQKIKRKTYEKARELVIQSYKNYESLTFEKALKIVEKEESEKNVQKKLQNYEI